MGHCRMSNGALANSCDQSAQTIGQRRNSRTGDLSAYPLNNCGVGRGRVGFGKALLCRCDVGHGCRAMWVFVECRID
jgi:hypothetical protein